MSSITRREILGWAALAPVLPNLLIQRADAAASADHYDGRVVIVVRLMGGNDGLNTLIPVRDDRYYRARPTIAIARQHTIAMAGGDLGLHPSLADFHSLIEAGDAGLVQGVGYPQSSRSHTRATEIWETASLQEQAPATGWLGRYLDNGCHCESQPLAGVQFTDTAARTLAAVVDHSRLIGNPDLLVGMNANAMQQLAKHGPASTQFAHLAQSQRELADAAQQLQRAGKGSGVRYGYPDSSFSQALRWAGNMIETECPTRVYYLTAGSFQSGAASFDTHLDQLATHQRLYAELSGGLQALATHLRATSNFKRTLLLTFSDFGRQLAENRTQGTDHGDAGVLFYAGGAVNAGLQGRMPDLGNVNDGGLRYSVDFRSVYAEVLSNWLRVPAAPLLGEDMAPLSIVRTA